MELYSIRSHNEKEDLGAEQKQSFEAILEQMSSKEPKNSSPSSPSSYSELLSSITSATTSSKRPDKQFRLQPKPAPKFIEKEASHALQAILEHF